MRAAAVAGALLLVWSGVHAQTPGVKAKPPRLGWPSAGVLLGVPVAPAAAGRVVTEVEPNSTIANANVVSLPETVNGVLNPSGDVDYFAVQLAAGTAVEIEVFSERIGSPADTYMELITPDGRTTIAASDDADPPGLDSRIRAIVPNSGRYIIGLVDLFSRGGTNFNYRLEIRSATLGPGDPTTLLAQNLGNAWQTAAGPGVLYMLNQEGTLSRVSPTGTVTPYLNDIGVPYDVALDGYGRLLIAGVNNSNVGVVTRVDPVTNARNTLIGSGLQSAASITVGPDGDIWVADTRAQRILRYDPAGTLRSSFSTANTHGPTVLDLAFAPSGVLYYSNMTDAIYRVVNNVPERVIQYAGIGGIAFDAAGNLYVGTVSRGVVLFSPSHQVLNDPFAVSGMQRTGAMVFMRDANGAMTSRLIGVNLTDGTMREMNPAGVRAPGFRVGVDLLTVATDSLKRGLMGAAYADTLRIAETQPGAAWTVTAGAPPRGVTLSPAGVLSGVPEVSGQFQFNVRVEGAGRIGVRTLRMEVSRPVVSASSASNHLLGVTGQLTPELARFLDLQGNNNGKYDIGDLKAYLRAQSPQGGRNQREER